MVQRGPAGPEEAPAPEEVPAELPGGGPGNRACAVDEIVRQYLDWDTARPYLPDLLRGFWVTIQIAFLAEVICLALGLLLAILRRTRANGRRAGVRIAAAATRGLAVAHINFFRGVPALLVLLSMYGSFPFLPVPVLEELTGFQIGFIGLGLVYAAYVAEVYRAGIESVDRGQTEAATPPWSASSP